MGENPTIFDKDHDTARRPIAKVIYNYYVQLVATKRD